MRSPAPARGISGRSSTARWPPPARPSPWPPREDADMRSRLDAPLAKPEWIKIRLKTGEDYGRIRGMVKELKLHTVCEEARCPNIFECWSHGTGTFMIMGADCTRRCGFCAVGKEIPKALDPDEPRHVAEAVKNLGLRHAVITSVDRDDLPDGGAAHFARTIHEVRRLN